MHNLNYWYTTFSVWKTFGTGLCACWKLAQTFVQMPYLSIFKWACVSNFFFAISTLAKCTDSLYAGSTLFHMSWIVSGRFFMDLVSMDSFHVPLLTTFYSFIPLCFKLQALSRPGRKLKRLLKEDTDTAASVWPWIWSSNQGCSASACVSKFTLRQILTSCRGAQLGSNRQALIWKFISGGFYMDG